MKLFFIIIKHSHEDLGYQRFLNSAHLCSREGFLAEDPIVAILLKLWKQPVICI